MALKKEEVDAYRRVNADKFRECRRKYNRKNRDKINEQRRANRLVNVQALSQIKKGSQCVDCGFGDEDCLIFRRADCDSKSMCYRAGSNSIHAITRDAKNREIVCHNCNILRNLPFQAPSKIAVEGMDKHQRLRRKKKDVVTAVKAERGCMRCGMGAVAVLNFHHRKPETKLFDINSGIRSRSLGDILLEIEKCDVVCRNCHVKIHAERGG